MRYEIDLACGRLTIDTCKEGVPLAGLLGFATRCNPKRGFLFVSKVLGKHIPCRPSHMRGIYDRLAESLRMVPGPVLVMGMAETATGLGGGVADSLTLKRNAAADVIYQHTTRHAVQAAVLVRFDEAHSHAPDHIVYAPQPGLARRYHNTETLVLVDDEITTGRTLMRLAEAMIPHLPKLKGIVFASIVNWLDAGRATEIRERLCLPLSLVSVLEGQFSFAPNPDFRAELPGQVIARRTAEVRGDTGRCGIRVGVGYKPLPRPPALVRNRPVYVIGTGELGYQPFLLAERLEELGYDIHYQSSTRSPILPGGAIAASLSCGDEHGEGVTNYLHNPPPPGAQVLVVYEAPHCAYNHDLPERLGAMPVILPDCDRRTSV
ncbi:MAG TPA: phosphoribosyltransferase domain-containing protein [Nitrococcus sp.]|nr:phosphoribosyltransferase domain-containing protein [Nitrococcus sp.]